MNFSHKSHYMKFIILILSFVVPILSFSQTLNLPARQTNALNGSQFVSLVTNFSLTDRENQIWTEITTGNVPDFQRTFIPVTITATINSTSYTVTFYVIPDYIAIGCDTDYFLCPMSPLMAQRIADFTSCILPTRKMVDNIWTSATVKLAPSTIPPSGQMTTIPVMNQHNTTVWGQRSAVLGSHPLGELVGGDKKDVIISNSIYGNPAPGRVVIYGWHQLNGNPIQPLYAGHEETYADYSHGIRLVQNAITINGSSNTVSAILQSSTLYSLLSDEGAIAIPHYPVTVVTLSIPNTFAFTNEDNTSLRLITPNDPAILQYKYQLSDDGISFNTAQYLPVSNTVITGLSGNHLYFIRIAAVNNSDTSAYSEVLAATTSACTPKTIIINGFDRSITGNTYNFIRQHGTAFYNNSTAFSSATNEAVAGGLINLTDYKIADYILGNESTVNETFSNSEQLKIITFLDNGGNLFISGGEIAWDLDHSGDSTDKDFYNTYLKAAYVNDAPNGQSNTFYQCTHVSGGIFDSIGNLSFDNGAHGTYNVSYPDVLNGINGGINCLSYSGASSQFSGVSYSGLFPNGSQPGKLVNLGFPFETIYPDSARQMLMNKILTFFNVQTDVAMPFVNSPVFYCQDDITVELAAIGQNLAWYNDSLSTSGNPAAPIPATNTPGTFSYYVTQSIDGCESDKNIINVIIKPKPVPPQITQSNDTIYADMLTGVHWFLNGNPVPGNSSPFIIPDSSGQYSASVTINGCTSNISNPIDFIETFSMDIYTEPLTKCIVYPNPVNNNSLIILNKANEKISEIYFYKTSGELISINNSVNANLFKLSSNGFETGLYFFRIITSSGEAISGRFLITQQDK